MNSQQTMPRWQHWLRYNGVKELLTAVSIMLFALAGFAFINPEGASIYPGPGGLSWRTLPFAYAALLLVLAIAYIVRSVLQIRQEVAAGPPLSIDAEVAALASVILFRRLASLGLLLVYVMLLRVFGFAIMTPIFLFALFRLYARGDWKGDVVTALIGGVCLWLLFVRILHLNLKGTFFDPLTPLLINALKSVGL